ncbi:DUF421 domain-containing protein [Mycobacterium sp. AT1]|uniref:DUF421 domain-containing protein n=1 Tax=Mycobacterium sp. AT1 TaxID=1961706 RepID=UPI0009AC6D81|nr:YetF domain-containing protein [Mycobacterium sp. AT1]
MNHVLRLLIGDLPAAVDAVIKTSALFLTAAVLFRITERRTLAEFAPFDWIAAVAAGAIVGRTAIASDTSWLTATAALLCLLTTHAMLSRLRYVPVFRRLIDRPLQVLIRDGQVDRRMLRRCGLTRSDLDAVLRQHGYHSAQRVHLAILEANGGISVLSGGPSACEARCASNTQNHDIPGRLSSDEHPESKTDVHRE